MLPRVLAAAATAWSLVYLVVYLRTIDVQDGSVAWWYVGLIVLAALSLGTATVGVSARAALTVGLLTSALAMLLGLLSLGALLAPTPVATAVALVLTRRAPNTSAPRDELRGA